MKQNKKKTALLVAAVALLIIIVVAAVMKKSAKQTNGDALQTQESIDEKQNLQSPSADENRTKASESETEKGEKSNLSSESSSDTPSTDGSTGDAPGDSAAADDMPDGSEWRNSMQGNSASGNAGDGKSESGGADEKDISFPYAIPNTDLTVAQVTSYDGVFVEDGSDGDIQGVATVLLQNTGDTGLEYARVTLVQGGTSLEFEASSLPAGASVIVQEKNCQAYVDGSCTSCTADVAQLDEFEMSEDAVRVEDNGDGSLTVTNLTDAEIPCVRIFYKLYMDEEALYVGGITYNSKVTNLAAGDSRKITPSHYAAGYSKIMMVRTYDTAE